MHRPWSLASLACRTGTMDLFQSSRLALRSSLWSRSTSCLFMLLLTLSAAARSRTSTIAHPPSYNNANTLNSRSPNELSQHSLRQRKRCNRCHHSPSTSVVTSHSTQLRGGGSPGKRGCPHVASDAFAPSISHSLRVGLAGGIAGAVGTAVLYPFDSAKTLRQSDPARYKSVRHALVELCRPYAASHLPIHPAKSEMSSWLRRLPGARAYNGLLAATLGAIPSSALYFGAYESMKRLIRSVCPQETSSVSSRLLVHAAAAASGNVISSAIFVPKELIKQQMQYTGGSFGRTMWKIMSEKGTSGLYLGYKATLMRNIPSACLRFVIYEELKRNWYTKEIRMLGQNRDSSFDSFSWRLFAAGAFAGAVASGFMTPIDVIKTRLATGTCPVDVPSCLLHVVQEQGWSGLYAGAGSRMAFSGAFSAIGFASFEAAKSWLGVQDSPPARRAR